MEYHFVGPGRLWNYCLLTFTFTIVLNYASPVQGVMSKLIPDNSTIAYACEGSTMYLSCKQDELIRIVRANYGRFSLTICNQHGTISGWKLQCVSMASKRIVAERCDGRRLCNITVNNNVFGDPCVNTSKYLEAHYYCVRTATTTPKPTTPTPKPSTKEPPPPSRTTSPLRVTTRPTPRPPITPVPTLAPTPTPNTDDEDNLPKLRTCEGRHREGVWWPLIEEGEFFERPCPEGRIGMMSWQCGKGEWIGEPDQSNCVSSWVKNVEDMMTQNSDAEETAEKMLQMTNRGKAIWVGDLKKTANTLLPNLIKLAKRQTVQHSKKRKKETMRRLTKNIVRTGSNLLSQEHSSSWEKLTAVDRSEVATSLAIGMEETGFEIASTLYVDESIMQAGENILMEVTAVDVTKKSMKFPSRSAGGVWAKDADQVTFPIESFQNAHQDGVVRIVFVVYQHLNEWMVSDSSSKDTQTDTKGYRSRRADTDVQSVTEAPNRAGTINSKIFSASVNNSRKPTPLKEPIIFTLRHIESQSGYDPVCSYWDIYSNEPAHWSRSGCQLVTSNDTHTTCQCNHLTNFAVLMDVSGTELSIEHRVSLQAITFIGCIISILCLFFSFFTFCFFKQLQCDRNTIHKNLVFSLMLAELLFLVGIGMTQNHIVCAVIAGVLHYLFLCAFGWMCLEGVQLYVMLIEVFEPGRSRSRIYYLCGYGIPAIVVGVAAGIQPSGYGTDTHCWLRTDNGFIWSFVGPVAAVITLNIIMLSIAVYMMCKHANTLASTLRTKEKSRLQKISQDPSSSGSGNSMLRDSQVKIKSEVPAWLKGAAVLVVLLGLTWVFGILYINKETVVMAYVFTVLNSLQGLFIFIFHCLLNEKVKKEYKKLAYRSTWLPSCLRDMCIGYSSSSSHNTSSSSGGHLLKFWSGRRRRKSSNSTLTTRGQNNKRKSDPRSDLDSYSSREQTIYTHGGSGRHSNKKSNGHSNGHIPHHRDMDGIAGDLSVADCSVIDSEYVSEYCHNNLQVSRETHRYSSASEETDHMISEEPIEKDRLSALSTDSALKCNSEFASSADGIDGDYMEPNHYSEPNHYTEVMSVENPYSEVLPLDDDPHRESQYEDTPLMQSMSEAEQNFINDILSGQASDSLMKKHSMEDLVSSSDRLDHRLDHSTPNGKYKHSPSNNNCININVDGNQDRLWDS
ncbi:adhesion G protein-coupled receptor L2-like isoform X2 [Mizuhopecten yessoensis]|uniref:adhesion G protein-coupled receptor L2-like isoform X2 n=1 Tax=Mizuhopecten yessoensis TaxID=6573 RepID=UPI000B457819|nr:adhesion G protein-coupled receptor L2-like isoform X2 [Mizuhopecten yessoensis]